MGRGPSDGSGSSLLSTIDRPEDEVEPTGDESTASRRSPRALTSFLALVVGLLVGGVFPVDTPTQIEPLLSVIELCGRFWIRTLEMVFFPLVVSLVVVAVSEPRGQGRGRLGVVTGAVVAGLLFISVIYGLVFGSLAVAVFPAPDELRAALTESGARQLTQPEAVGGVTGFGGWVEQVVPDNPFAAAMNRSLLLQVMFFALMFGIALRRADSKATRSVRRFFVAFREISMALIYVLLRFTPLGVLAVGLSMARRIGPEAAGGVAYHATLLTASLVLPTAIIFLVTPGAGRYQVGQLARALHRAQLIGITRSSLATLPALVEAGRGPLRVPRRALDFALPLAAASLRFSLPSDSVFRVVVLAHLFGFEYSPVELISFMAGVTLTSFASSGMPTRLGVTERVGFYLALGIPLELYLLVKASEVIPDIFKTTANSIAYLATAILTARLTGAATATAHRPAVMGA